MTTETVTFFVKMTKSYDLTFEEFCEMDGVTTLTEKRMKQAWTELVKLSDDGQMEVVKRHDAEETELEDVKDEVAEKVLEALQTVEIDDNMDDELVQVNGTASCWDDFVKATEAWKRSQTPIATERLKCSVSASGNVEFSFWTESVENAINGLATLWDGSREALNAIVDSIGEINDA